MIYFLLNLIIWTLALYGAVEITKTIIYYFTYSIPKIKEKDGIYIIVATKNQEENIEGLLRSDLLKIKYGKKDANLKEILFVDLLSEDNTKHIAEKISQENNYIKVVDWEECKRTIEEIYQKN